MALVVTGAIPAAAHEHIIVGGEGVVSNTNGAGVNVRNEPSIDSPVQSAAAEGERVEVTAGPQESGGYLWYGVSINDTEGWLAGDFLTRPAVGAGDLVTVVNTDGHGLRLRSDATMDSTTLTVIPEGTTVEAVGDQYGDGNGDVWFNVSYGDQMGFASGDYLVLDTGTAGASAEAATNSAEPQQTDNSGVVIGGNAEILNTDGDGLNIRHGAGYGNSVATVAAEGDVMRILDGPSVDADGVRWWNIDYKGVNGWAHGDYLVATDREVTSPTSAETATASSGGGESTPESAAPANATGEAIVNTAMQHLGTPYVWGGTTPGGFDCSGFLQYVVNEVTGGGFPRILEPQVNTGTHVSTDNLQPGDLVFQQNTYRWGLSHGGIYIGDGQFIHAGSASTGVTISNLWDSYWGQRFYTARRIT